MTGEKAIRLRYTRDTMYLFMVFAVLISFTQSGLTANADSAGGDILFIDVNSSSPEIDLVNAYIANEKLQGREQTTRVIVVPSLKRISLEKRRKINSLFRTHIDPGTDYYSKNCSDGTNPNVKKCDEVLARANEGRAQVYEIIRGHRPNNTRSLGSYDLDEVISDLHDALSGPFHFSRIIISGHHFPGDYTDSTRLITGALFSGFSTTVAADLLNSYSSTKNARSLILLGCWTGRYEQFQLAWNFVLPNAPFRSGFIDAAPHNYDPDNLLILNSLLQNEKRVGEARTREELAQLFSNIAQRGRNMAVRVKNWYASRSGIKDI